MSRDNIIGLLLIAAIFIGYSILTAPTEEQKQEARRIQDSIRELRLAEQEMLREEQSRVNEESATMELESLELSEIHEEESDSLRLAALRNQLGYFAGAAAKEKESITIESELLKLNISTKGGFVESVELKKYKTWEKEPLILFFDENNIFNLQFYSTNRLIGTQGLVFSPYIGGEPLRDGYNITINPSDSLTLSLRLYPDNHTPESPKYLEWVYHIRDNDYMIDIQLNTVGLQDVIAANSTFLNLDWRIDMPRQEKSRKNEQNVSTVYYKYLGDDVGKLRETRDASQSLTTSVKWISFKQQFFSSVLIAGNSFSSAQVSTITFDESYDDLLKRMTASIDIPYNSRENNQFPMSFYFGPNHFQTLKQYGLELESQIPLGWAIMGWINRFVVIPVFNYLDSFNLNYGIIILLLTLMLKLALFPIAYKTYLSSARMRVLKPDIDALSEKFPKKEDAMKKQQAVMALYKKAGVNPMAGCVPMLLQLPILLALFRFFPASIELRQEGFLWADDLSSYDSILDLPFTIPFYGDHVSLFTLLMTVSTIIYTRMNSQMMNTGTQMPGMKTMLYIMPVMLLGIFNNFASGLSYYYFLANVITFGQMYAFRFMIDEDKIHKRIEENKKKPVKKSGWQKRLEDMAKQQQVQQKKRKK
jgi:YidC/Oxa1 family membrane protein insertase